MSTNTVTFFKRSDNGVLAKAPLMFAKDISQRLAPAPQINLKELMVYLKTTETCQLNCEHCFTNGTNGRKIYFSVPKTIDWFHRMKAAVPKLESAHVAFHGGEPFLAPVSDMKEVWSSCKDLWPSLWWSTTTNLVYKLDNEKIDFMKTAFSNGLATSWDKGIRFSNQKQEDLWRDNVKTLLQEGMDVTLMVSLSKSVVDVEPIELLNFVSDLGVKYLHLERITPNGNANLNPHIFPTNKELDAWFVKMWHQSVEHGMYKKFENLFFNSILSSLTFTTHSGCRCRQCEQKIFTINADGNIGGCPNSAVDNTFGSLEDDIPTLLTSPGRMANIACESSRNPLCYSCEVFDICNGDCHQLAWEGDICASPKSLMKHFKQENNIGLYREVLGEFMGQE
jgi:radical SAM protein with 4Fe4S-binding SPASM domain